MATEQRSTIASKEELLSLKNHFKDFGFPEYPFLKDDCKKHIIKCLDGRSRIRIEMCSKHEKELAHGIPLKLFGIVLDNLRIPSSSPDGTEKVGALFDNGGDKCEILFSQRGTCVVAETVTGRLLWTHDNGVVFKEAVAFFEFLLKKCHYGVERFTLQSGRDSTKWAGREGSPIERLPNVKYVEFSHSDDVEIWLKKMSTTMETFFSFGDVNAEAVALQPFLNARQLNCHERCDLTDAQLLELNAFNIYIEFAPRVTTHGVNAFLKRWVCGGGVDGFQRLVIRFIGRDDEILRVEDVHDILDGIDVVATATGPRNRIFSIHNKARPNEYIEFRFTDLCRIYAKVYAQ